MWRISSSSAVEPSTGVSRLRAPTRTSPAPTISGAMRRTAGLRFSASASSSVRSRGVLPSSTPGMAPAVSLRPGSTITRLVPSEPNWFATYRRAPSPSEVTTTTAATPMPIASRISSVRDAVAAHHLPGEIEQVGESHRSVLLVARRSRRPSCAAAGARARRSPGRASPASRVPPSSCTRSSTAMTSCPVWRSRLPVGSSARITAGRMDMARAIATRWHWPPESWSGRWRARASRPYSASSRVEPLRCARPDRCRPAPSAARCSAPRSAAAPGGRTGTRSRSSRAARAPARRR